MSFKLLKHLSRYLIFAFYFIKIDNSIKQVPKELMTFTNDVKKKLALLYFILLI